MSHSTHSAGGGTHGDPIPELIERLGRLRSSWSRRTRAVMLVQAALMATIGLFGWWQLASSGAATTQVAGVRLGPPAVVTLLLAAVAIALASPWPQRALRRVALATAIIWTAVFVAGAVYYPDLGGPWQSNAATAAMFAVGALAGFAEFVMLNSDVFEPDPGTLPW